MSKQTETWDGMAWTNRADEFVEVHLVEGLQRVLDFGEPFFALDQF